MVVCSSRTPNGLASLCNIYLRIRIVTHVIFNNNPAPYASKVESQARDDFIVRRSRHTIIPAAVVTRRAYGAGGVRRRGPEPYPPALHQPSVHAACGAPAPRASYRYGGLVLGFVSGLGSRFGRPSSWGVSAGFLAAGARSRPPRRAPAAVIGSDGMISSSS